MSFLGKIFGRSSESDDHAPEQPVRARTFSATQFRESELARAAESRARVEERQIDAAAVLSPAINPVAETLMAAESDAAEPAIESAEPPAQPVAQEAEWPEPESESAEPETESGEPDADYAEPEAELVEPQEEYAEPEAEPAVAPAPAPAHDPMPWDEAVGWLSQRSSETRNFVGTYWNWDHDLRVLHFLAQQPDLDAGVAAHIFWITAAAEDYFPFGDDEPDSEVAQQIGWLTDFLGRRFAEGAFRPASYGFDDSWDCERLKERLADLYGEGRIEWSPEAIPTSSSAELMSFNDVPEGEREEVTDFLARFGVY